MMLAIQQKDESKLKVNVLPAKIHYDGPIEVEKKYWAPEHREGARRKPDISDTNTN